MRQELCARIDQAFSHLMLIGLACVLEQQGVNGVRIYWTNSMDPRPVIEARCEWMEACEHVREYAARMAAPSGWIWQDVTVAGKRKALFSPRLGNPDSAEWVDLHSRRHTAAARLAAAYPVDWLSLRLIGALGAPAYWGPERTGKVEVDQGASRWEMKTRNAGEEFVGQRFSPLTSAVASRGCQEISDGLLGRVVLDERGKPTAPDSRLATGLRPPGPVDAVQAWCGLVGVSSFPVLHHVHRLTSTAGYEGAYSGGIFHIPVPGRSMSPPKVRAVISSDVPVRFLSSQAAADRAAAADSLANWGVVAVAKFPMSVSSNPSAPERWASVGEIVPVGGVGDLGGTAVPV